MARTSANASGLAGRYATALFDLARDEGVLDHAARDLDALDSMIEESSDLRLVLKSPLLSRGEQNRAIQALARKAGFHATVAKFLGLLGEKRRLFALADIIGAFHQMHRAERGEVSAEVTSAVALSEEQEEAVKEAVGAHVGKQVAITTSVDPSLLGGLVVRIGSRLVDASLRSKLRHLELAMRGAG